MFDTTDNELYQAAQKKVDETINELKKAGLSREQNKVVDRAISAANASGAAYGANAYKQGMYDGIKLMLEVNQISQTVEVLNGQKQFIIYKAIGRKLWLVKL